MNSRVIRAGLPFFIYGLVFEKLIPKRHYKQWPTLKWSNHTGFRKPNWYNIRISQHFDWSDIVVPLCWHQWIRKGPVSRYTVWATNSWENQAIRRAATFSSSMLHIHQQCYYHLFDATCQLILMQRYQSKAPIADRSALNSAVDIHLGCCF